MEVFSLVKILPFLLMFGLIASNAVNGGPLQEKMKKGNKQKDITRNRRSAHLFGPLECYRKFLAGGKPPDGLRLPNFVNPEKYICQGKKPGESYYATLFDEDLGIPVYSAYTLTKDNIDFKQQSRPDWSQTTGIKKQGYDELYPSLPFHKGHLAPAHTLSSKREAFVSTFTYTNAVPQRPALNSGMWSQFERKIRNYAKQDCIGRQGGTLYILTGTLFVKWTKLNHVVRQDPHKIPWLAITNKYRYLPPAIAIPTSMWTAGCCVANFAAKGNFAVFANNEETRDEAQARQVDINDLQTVIKADVKSDKFKGVNLFPVFPGCKDKLKRVNLDDYNTE